MRVLEFKGANCQFLDELNPNPKGTEMFLSLGMSELTNRNSAGKLLWRQVKAGNSIDVKVD